MRKDKKYKIVIAVLAAVIIAQFIFIILSRPAKLPARVSLKPAKTKIAIVIDDWGYNLNNPSVLGQIKYPFTAAILPNLAYSRRMSDELHSRGFEVIAHLPMEPNEKYRLENNTILTTMDEQTIKAILNRGLESVAWAKGVSNHMGSAATGDERVMGIVLGELKKRRLYFLDSFVSGRTVCPVLARKIGVNFTRRDIFLDNKQDPEYIKSQINRLKRQARVYGKAIGIGHDRKITLEVLKEVLPELAKEGYKLVFVSELVN